MTTSPAIQKVTFHGGPLHGQTRIIQHGVNAVQVAGIPNPFVVPNVEEDPETPLSDQITKLATYSRVGRSQDFEWEGWRAP